MSFDLKHIKKFVLSSFKKSHGSGLTIERVRLRHGVVDFLYLILGLFTHMYGACLTILFFSGRGAEFPIFVTILDTFQEVYLGSLGVYVILKEVRKRYHKEQSRHLGEYFVAAWAMLFFSATLTVFISPQYGFDEVYKLIVINSLATLIIYLGSLISKP